MLQFLLNPSEKKIKKKYLWCAIDVSYIKHLDTLKSINYPSPSVMYNSLCFAMLYFSLSKNGKNKIYCILYAAKGDTYYAQSII